VKAETFAGMLISIEQVPYNKVEGRMHLDIAPFKTSKPWAAFLPTRGNPASWVWDFDNLAIKEPTTVTETADGERFTYTEIVRTVFVAELTQLEAIAKLGVAKYKPELVNRIPRSLHSDREFPVWPLPLYIRVSYNAMRRQAHIFLAIVAFADHLSQGDFIRALPDDERQLL
jgi:hypothetical protein